MKYKSNDVFFKIHILNVYETSSLGQTQIVTQLDEQKSYNSHEAFFLDVAFILSLDVVRYFSWQCFSFAFLSRLNHFAKYLSICHIITFQQPQE